LIPIAWFWKYQTLRFLFLDHPGRGLIKKRECSYVEWLTTLCGCFSFFLSLSLSLSSIVIVGAKVIIQGVRSHLNGRRAKSVTNPAKLQDSYFNQCTHHHKKQRWKKNPHIFLKAGKDVHYFRNRIKELHNRQGTAQVVAAATAASSYKRLVSEVEKDSLISVS